MDIDGIEFYNFLNGYAEREIGPAEEGFVRNITFQSSPERGVIELTIVDTAQEVPENETVQ